jgi:hypothetical protein
MKRRDFVISTCTGLAGLSLTANGAVQQKTSQPDLFALAEKKGFQVLTAACARQISTHDFPARPPYSQS